MGRGRPKKKAAATPPAMVVLSPSSNARLEDVSIRMEGSSVQRPSPAGYFIIRFKSKMDRDAVLLRGPYTIYRKPMFLHKWTLDFTLKDDLLRVLPIWVTFPQLPLIFWGEKSIGKIASAIGKPMMTDECTAKKLRVSLMLEF
jgi:hypothetical protein